MPWHGRVQLLTLGGTVLSGTWGGLVVADATTSGIVWVMLSLLDANVLLDEK